MWPINLFAGTSTLPDIGYLLVIPLDTSRCNLYFQTRDHRSISKHLLRKIIRYVSYVLINVQITFFNQKSKNIHWISWTNILGTFWSKGWIRFGGLGKFLTKQEAQRATVAHLSTMNMSKRISGLWIGGRPPSKAEKLKYLLYTQWFAKLEEILFILTLQSYLHLNFHSFSWDIQWNVLTLKPFQ